MIKLLLGLDKAPSPHDAADALAVAICHLHSRPPAIRDCGRSADVESGSRASRSAAARRPPRKSWRQYRPPAAG